MRRAALLTGSALVSSTLTFACAGDPPMRRYHARGVVKEITGGGSQLSASILHEAIPHFEGRDGKQAEMPSMTMDFGVADDMPRALFGQGQKIAFDFEVRWSQRPAMRIVKAEALSPETELHVEDRP